MEQHGEAAFSKRARVVHDGFPLVYAPRVHLGRMPL